MVGVGDLGVYVYFINPAQMIYKTGVRFYHRCYYSLLGKFPLASDAAINLPRKLKLSNEDQAVRLSPERRSERWRAEEMETERRQKETRSEGE